MQNGEVVGSDKEVDGVQVVLRALGKGAGTTYQAAGSRPPRAKEAFDVASLAFVFAATTMGVAGKCRGVCLPVVAAGATVPVA